MQLVEKISIAELAKMSERMYDELVKAVVDVDKRLVVVDADMHVDEELFLLEQGSRQESLWGINLLPQYYGSDDFVEFDSIINIRPAQGNRTRSVDDPDMQKLIREIIDEVVDG